MPVGQPDHLIQVALHSTGVALRRYRSIRKTSNDIRESVDIQVTFGQPGTGNIVATCNLLLPRAIGPMELLNPAYIYKNVYWIANWIVWAGYSVVNSMRPNDTIRPLGSGPTLVQVLWIGTCLAPSHYLNQYWIIVNWTHRNKLQWNFNQNIIIFIWGNAFHNVVCKITTNLFWLQCLKHAHVDGQVQERCNSTANALELCLLH